MTSAIADPNELEQFAAALCRFQDALKENTAMMNSAFSTVSETWRDQEQAKFEGEYQELVRLSEDFCGRISEHVPYLRQKAQHLRDYLER